MLLKVGDLAKRTGLTVRTLHHYDEVGLLSPTGRTDSGYRLYNHDDVVRLHRIQALRQLGLGLAEIAQALTADSADLNQIIQRHLDALESQIAASCQLRDRLKELQFRLPADEESDTESWLEAVEMTLLLEKHLSGRAAALRQTKQNGETDGDRTGAQWRELVAIVRAHMIRGTPTDDPEVLEMALRWRRLLEHSLGDRLESHADLIGSLARMYREEPRAQELHGIDSAMLDYIAVALLNARSTGSANDSPGESMGGSLRRFESDYRRAAPWDIGRPQPAFTERLGRLQTGGSVLDVGCGSGELALWMTQHGNAVTAIDFSPAAIDLAVRKSEQRMLAVDFRQCDALLVQAPAGGFEIVLDSGFLHCLAPTQQKALWRTWAGSWRQEHDIMSLGLRSL